MRCSWRRRKPIKQSILDVLIISETFLILTPKIYYEDIYRSDPSSVEFKKGKDKQKFSNTLLTDKKQNINMRGQGLYRYIGITRFGQQAKRIRKHKKTKTFKG